MSVGDVNEPTTSHDDPWKYGWRYVKRVDAEGKEHLDQVPLTLEGFLYPEEGDFRVETVAHVEDCQYLYAALRQHLRSRTDAIVLCDCRIDWGGDEVRPLGPDVAVFFGKQGHSRTAGTFYREDFEARPVFVIEVTSPSTRNKDVDDKVDLFWRARVPLYLIVDSTNDEGADVREMELIGYQAGLKGYERIEPDAQGRFQLTPLSLWLVAKNGKAVLQTENGEDVGDYLALAEEGRLERERNAELTKLIEEEIAFRQETEQREREAERIRAEETQKRIEAEEREREAERIRTEETQKRIAAEERERQAKKQSEFDSQKRSEAEQLVQTMREEMLRMQAEMQTLRGNA